MELVTYFLYSFARRIPMLLLCLVAIGFAIARWKRHPRVSLMTVLALAFYLVEAFVFLCFRYWVPSLIQTMRMSDTAINTIFTVMAVVDDFGFAVIIILLVAAAFTGRVPAVTTDK